MFPHILQDIFFAFIPICSGSCFMYLIEFLRKLFVMIFAANVFCRFWEKLSRYICFLSGTNWPTRESWSKREEKAFPFMCSMLLPRWFALSQFYLMILYGSTKIDSTLFCFKMSLTIFSFIRKYFVMSKRSSRLWLTILLLVWRSYMLSKRLITLRDAVEFSRLCCLTVWPSL